MMGRFSRAAVVAVTALVVGTGCNRQQAPAVLFQSVPVERRDVVVSARATGTIQPDTVVEVKSKASGEILEMRAETGATVQRGTLLVRSISARRATR